MCYILMKILQISTGFDIEYNGGITNYVRSLSQELSKNSKDNEVIVLDSTELKVQNNELEFKRVKLKKLKLNPFHYRNVLKNRDTEKVLEIIEKISPDIVHIHMMLDLPLEIIEKIQERYKTILSLHDYSWFCNQISLIDIDEKNCENCLKGLKCESCVNLLYKNKFFRFLIKKNKTVRFISKKMKDKKSVEKIKYMKEIFKKFECILAVSNRVKELYIKNEFNNKNFLVNHIGNITANKEFREKFIDRRFNNDIKLGFIGNFTKNKGANILINLANNIKNEILIYGRINKEYLKEIEKHKNIKYCGEYTQLDLKNILCQIDIGLVLPIWEDNAPQVVFEMQNALIPIIATKMGGIPDFVKHDFNGILIEPNKNGIEKAKEFLDNINLKIELLKYRKNLCAGTKKPKDHAIEIEKIYKEILFKNI